MTVTEPTATSLNEVTLVRWPLLKKTDEVPEVLERAEMKRSPEAGGSIVASMLVLKPIPEQDERTFNEMVPCTVTSNDISS